MIRTSAMGPSPLLPSAGGEEQLSAFCLHSASSWPERQRGRWWTGTELYSEWWRCDLEKMCAHRNMRRQAFKMICILLYNTFTLKLFHWWWPIFLDVLTESTIFSWKGKKNYVSKAKIFVVYNWCTKMKLFLVAALDHWDIRFAQFRWSNLNNTLLPQGPFSPKHGALGLLSFFNK